MSNLTYGSRGQAGHQGTSGPGGYQITDWKEDMMKKYPQFTIKIEYEPMKNYIDPIHVIIDTHEVRVSKDTKRTNKEYKLTLTSISDIMNETDLFIQGLIVNIRDKKINDIINGY